jgi:N4-gp56 family major capsid protein
MGTQLETHHYQKLALIEARKEQYFSQLADVTAMPKNMGKTIKRYHYLPLLDDANINDQGIDAAGVVSVNGNLYGSSKDIGSIPAKLPVLSESGGRVNRVGFKRKELEGTIEKFGFFDEYTQESMDFDTDADLWQHINREMVSGANEMTEDALQIDLINSAGVIKYAGNATSNATVGADDLVSYGDLLRLSIDLDNNRTPKHTKVITGTRMVDTNTINAARVMYIGSELLPHLKGLKDLHNNPAFISVEKYAAGGTTLTGEVGSIDQFRIVVVPEMMKWAGAGASAVGSSTHYETGDVFDVFPMLVVGDSSFTTIGFQTDGKTVKFKITHKKPGEETADRNDPYGETGFMSIKWYYGFMVLRPERIALIKTAATL